MKCQAWVDPMKFNKKNRPTPRARVATGGVDLPHAKTDLLRHYKQGTKPYAKYEAQLDRAVRCGGRLEVDVYADGDEEGYTGGTVVEITCVDCRESIHPAINLDSEIAVDLLTAWVESLCDECGRAKGHSIGCLTGNATAEKHQSRK